MRPNEGGTNLENEAKNTTGDGIRLGINWLLVNALALCMVAATARLILIAYATGNGGEIYAFLTIPLSLVVFGGILQWLVLRNRGVKIYWWLLACLSGLVAGYFTAPYLSHGLARGTGGDLGGAPLSVLSAASAGALLGLMQWLALRRHVQHSGWWVIASALGWAAASLMARSAMEIDPLQSALGGGIYGLISGLFLAIMVEGKPAYLYSLAGITLVLVAGVALLRPGDGLLAPRRGPYVQYVTANSAWVVWDTRSPSTGKVEYGTTPGLSDAVEDGQATEHHELRLIGLQPSTQYFYQVDHSEMGHFTTAASPGESRRLRFAVYGDSRGSYMIHPVLVQAIARRAPDFVLYTGDMVEAGQIATEFDDFLQVEERLMRTAPLYPTLGNHEMNSEFYFDAFHLPGDERNYAFDHGDVRVICLEADGEPLDRFYPLYDPDPGQMEWLETQLAGDEQPWKIVFFHLSIYTSRRDDSLEISMRKRLAPLFERYGVDVVFSGHDHAYERLFKNGVTYIVAAGGGAPLYEFSVPEAYSQARARAYHYVWIEIDGDRLSGTAIGWDGKTIDRFEIINK
jgi:hypothetical protein